jgi:hypothetical protein
MIPCGLLIGLEGIPRGCAVFSLKYKIRRRKHAVRNLIVNPGSD